jgi:hypothetical protein
VLSSIEDSAIEVCLSIRGSVGTLHHHDSMAYAGILDRRVAKALGELSRRCAVTLVATAQGVGSKDVELKTIPTRCSKISIIVYGLKKDRRIIGGFLSDSEIFLQHPQNYDNSVPYDNPHYLVRPGHSLSTPEVLLRPGGSPKPSPILSDDNPLKAQVLQVFDYAQGPQVYPEVSASSRISTTLKT